MSYKTIKHRARIRRFLGILGWLTPLWVIIWTAFGISAICCGEKWSALQITGVAMILLLYVVVPSVIGVIDAWEDRKEDERCRNLDLFYDW
jgi:4-hydroxybenzoate polyprenyltransferase